MNVTLEKNGNVNGVITISFKEEDYQSDVKKELARIGREHPLKGFRPGHVPAALLKKHYGNEVLVNVIDRKVSKALNDYIQENKLDVLGEPMLSKDTKINFNTDKDFDFKFDLGFAPEFDIKLDKRVKVPFYEIEVSQEIVDKQNDNFKKRFGKQVPGEVASEDSLLRGSMAELNEDGTDKADGIKVEKTIISPQYLKSADEKAKFVGHKVNDEIVFNPFKAADGNLTELAAMLNVDKKDAEVKSDFKFVPSEILVNQDAEVNQEFFDNVLGKDEAKDEKEYLEKLKEMIANQLKNDSNYRFTIDAEDVLKKKVGDLELPDEFLKRFLAARAGKDADEKKIEEDYPKTKAQIVWQLIKEKVARNLNVKLEKEDVMRLARFFAAQQFAQYGMTNIPDDVIEKYAGELLEKQEYANEIHNRAFEDKLFAAIKEAVALNVKNVTVDEFNKLFEK